MKKLLSDSRRVSEWLTDNRHLLEAGGAAYIGSEPNTLPASDFALRRVRVLVARLSSYRDVAASASHGAVAEILQRSGDVFCDFAFLPSPKDRLRMLEGGVPLWFGINTRRPAADFDVLAISASYVAEYFNLPHLLSASGLPLCREDRLDDPAVPLVMLGGASASHTAVLHGDAAQEKGGLVDAVLFGEAEAAAPALVPLLEKWKNGIFDKRELLLEAARTVPGFYLPSLYEHRHAGDPQRLVSITPKNDAPFPVRRATARSPLPPEALRLPIPYDEDGIGTARIRISMGCPYPCSFCQEGWDQKPYRERSAEELRSALREAKARQGAVAVDLYSFNFNMHRELGAILADSAALFGIVTLRSQRLDLLGRNPACWEAQRMLGKRIATFGVEGISARLRRFLGKRLPEEDLGKGLAVVFASPPLEIKIFLIGTGLEKEEDYSEFEDFCARFSAKAAKAGCRVILSLTPLLASPHTPLALRGVGVGKEAFAAFEARVKVIARAAGLEARSAVNPSEIAVLQLLLLGDRRMTAALSRSQAQGKSLFYGEVPEDLSTRFTAELAKDGLGPANFLFERGEDEVLPWDDISPGPSKGFLRESYLRAAAFEEPVCCFDDAGGGTDCLDCGACKEPSEIPALTKRDSNASYSFRAIARAMENRRSPDRLHVKLDVEERFAPAPEAFWAAALARALMLAEPSLADAYIEPDASEPVMDGACGERWVGLRFRKGSLESPPDPAAVQAHLMGAAVIEMRREAPEYPRLVEYGIEAPFLDRNAFIMAIKNSRGATPLPLEQRNAAEGRIILEASGKKAGSCPVLSASIELLGKGFRALVLAKPRLRMPDILKAAAKRSGQDAMKRLAVRVRLK